jgi:lactate racemase
MSVYSLKYGKGFKELTYQENFIFSEIAPVNIPGVSEPVACIQQALENPLSCLPEFSGKTISIAINDKTRPVPHEYLLPPLLDFLLSRGVNQDQITFYIATGTHLPVYHAEFPLILPPSIVNNYHILSHDCDDISNLCTLGVTKAGTIVRVNSSYHSSDIKIVVGNIEPHHFMGFSGGNKTAAIGLTSRETINHNHSFLVSGLSRTGEYLRNPCRQDVEEIGKMIEVDLALNAILTPRKEIAYALFGDPITVMEKGVPLSRQICQVQVDEPFDLVIASAGGYPKDINLYQAQKAITNAASITRDGGDIILFAECIEGAGSQSFLDFMQDVLTPDEAIDKFTHTEFKIGPHKAFQLARQAGRLHIHMASSMSSDLVNRLFIHAVGMKDIEEIIELSLANSQKVAIMPNAVATIPFCSWKEIEDDR